MSLAPILASLFAWILLGEVLTWIQFSGIFIAISGVIWVTLVRDPVAIKRKKPENFWLGLLFGLGGAVGQALGLVLSKKGLAKVNADHDMELAKAEAT